MASDHTAKLAHAPRDRRSSFARIGAGHLGHADLAVTMAVYADHIPESPPRTPCRRRRAR
ncbi:hypothetical protein I548_4409 [Mycobacterium intracellulare]|nr:hypothetical protein I548_4409 [Mycobacterium intracellulare]